MVLFCPPPDTLGLNYAKNKLTRIKLDNAITCNYKTSIHVQNITCIEEQYMYRTTMHVQNNTCTEQLYMYMVYCVEKTTLLYNSGTQQCCGRSLMCNNRDELNTYKEPYGTGCPCVYQHNMTGKHSFHVNIKVYNRKV